MCHSQYELAGLLVVAVNARQLVGAVETVITLRFNLILKPDPNTNPYHTYPPH